MKILSLALIITAISLSWFSPAEAANFTTVKETITIISGPVGLNSEGSIIVPVDKLQLDGDNHMMTAVTAPVFLLQDASGTQGGWELTFQASDLIHTGSRHIISASHLKFKPSPYATLIKLTGQAIDPVNGPKEVDELELPLNTPQKIVTSGHGYGKGRYLFVTHPASFLQEFPADLVAGNYSGTLTATMITKP